MNGILLLLPVFLPLVLGLLSYFLPIRSESCRRLVYSLLILGTTALAWAAILLCDDGAFTLLHFSHRLTIAFRMDGAARLFAGLSATLWPFTMLYGFDYMRHEKHLHMFWAFFTASFGVTLGIAFSANMMTMYLFYELLTLATHDQGRQKGGHQVPGLLHLRRGPGVYRPGVPGHPRCGGLHPGRPSGRL